MHLQHRSFSMQITLFQIWILKKRSAAEYSLLMISTQVPCLLQELQKYLLSVSIALFPAVMILHHRR